MKIFGFDIKPENKYIPEKKIIKIEKKKIGNWLSIFRFLAQNHSKQTFLWLLYDY